MAKENLPGLQITGCRCIKQAKWYDDAAFGKHIIWHCDRHSFSILLQDRGNDLDTVAGIHGHTSTKYGQKTYNRSQKSNAVEAINKLPNL